MAEILHKHVGGAMPVKKLKEFLDANGVKYICIRHSRAFTAQEIAAKAHIPGKEMAKTVILVVDGKQSMAVLPASYRIDLEKLKELTGANKIAMPTEQRFIDLFPDCEAGAMPPFGNLYDMDVYVAESLAEDEHIAFNAGNHTEIIQLKYEDFNRLVQPKVLPFSIHLD